MSKHDSFYELESDPDLQRHIKARTGASPEIEEGHNGGGR